MKTVFDLQLFADVSGASGSAASAGQGAVGGNGTDGGQITVVYGKQAAGTDTPSAGEDASAANVPTKSKAELFAEMINGEYKDEYAKATQKIINKRFREAKTTQETLDSQQPIMELLSQRYGTKDAAKLAEHLQNDTALWQDLADEQGLTVPQQQEMMRLRMAEQSKDRIIENYREAERQRQQMQRWQSEAEALKQKYPAFNLEKEVENEAFVRLVRSGVPMEHAFTVTHLEDILGGAMQATQQQTEANVVANIRARGMRPQENGTKKSGGVVYKTDPTKFTKADRAEILKRMAKGEVFEF